MCDVSRLMCHLSPVICHPTTILSSFSSFEFFFVSSYLGNLRKNLFDKKSPFLSKKFYREHIFYLFLFYFFFYRYRNLQTVSAPTLPSLQNRRRVGSCDVLGYACLIQYFRGRKTLVNQLHSPILRFYYSCHR